MAAAKSEEMVGAILKKDAADGEKAMKRFATQRFHLVSCFL